MHGFAERSFYQVLEVQKLPFYPHLQLYLAEKPECAPHVLARLKVLVKSVQTKESRNVLGKVQTVNIKALTKQFGELELSQIGML